MYRIKLLVLLFVCIHINSFAHFVNMNDSNFAQRLLDLGYNVVVESLEIEDEDVIDVTFLDLSNADISDLEGLQYFQNLETLILDNNFIDDLGAIIGENLTNLKHLSIRNNLLTDIDLEHNDKLEYLDLRGNELFDIDLSHKEKLKTVLLSNNKFVNLDDFILPTEVIVIETLNFDNNSLTSLSGLNNIPSLKNLSANDNSLTSLDVSSLKLLEALSLNNNSLTSLNVQNGNNQNFTSFSITGNSGLSCVKVDDLDYSTNNWTNKDADTGYTTTDQCNLSSDRLDKRFYTFSIIDNVISIDGALIKVASIEIMNLHSQTLKTASGSSINISDLTSGMYMVLIHTAKGTGVEKIIK